MFTKSAAFYDAVYAAKDYAGEAERIDALIQVHARTSGKTLLLQPASLVADDLRQPPHDLGDESVSLSHSWVGLVNKLAWIPLQRP